MNELPQLGEAGAVDNKGRRLLRRLLAGALIVLSAIYIFRILSVGLVDSSLIALSLTPAEWTWLVTGILGTLGLSAIYHVLAVRRIQVHSVPGSKVALAYALGQVMRYIPGRVFGLVFEVRYLAGHIRAASIGLALLVQTAYDYAWAAIFLGAVLLACARGTPWPLALLIPAVGLVWLLHARGLLERALASPRLIRKWLGDEQLALLQRPSHAVGSTAALVLVWIPMLAGIAMALASSVGYLPALVIGALYLASAVLSLLVFVVPSGLLVREALFAWLGARFGFPSDMIVMLGLLLRLLMTASEVLLVAVCLAVEFARSLRGNRDPLE